ncbi:MAG: hypothetical protein ACKOHG_03210 [Planctomycetia bacterium]
MAKSARGSVASGVSSDRVRSLCTPAERKLLDMSESKTLSQAAPAEVQALLGRAREFRDKWRALVGKQSRAAKRAPRAVAEANARSHAKAELFDGAVKRFETQLKTLPAKAVAPGAAKPTAVRAKPPKRSRVAGHRTARAGLRAELAAKVATLNPPAAKPAAKPVAAAAKKAAVAAKPSVAAAAPAAAKVVPVSKAKQRKLPPAKAAAAAQAVRFDNAKQRSAATLAKKSRLKVGGLATRRGSHVMAAGKRAQARRDKRR